MYCFHNPRWIFFAFSLASFIYLDLCFPIGFGASHENFRLRSKLPEEEMKLYGFSNYHHQDHDHSHDNDLILTGLGPWLHALGCSLLVSLASLICLIILPIKFIKGKPSKAVVDLLALFGAGAMLGDAFIHQLPHSFGGEHSHSHDHGMDHSHHSHAGHARSLKDLSVGLSVLAGIVLFLLAEKVVTYVEANSSGSHSWGHSHHHHQSSNKKLKDEDSEAIEKVSDGSLGDSLNGHISSEHESHLRKRKTKDDNSV